MPTLTEIITGLDAPTRDHLSAIHIERLPDDHWQVRISIAVWVNGVTHIRTEAGTIRADLSDLPEGVAAVSGGRYPHLLAEIDGDVEAQIRDLQASGVIGDIDAARMEPVATGGPHDGRVVYIVKPLRDPWGKIDLVGRVELAQRAGTTPGMVDSWRLRHADFPVPVAPGPVWNWRQVEAWLAKPRPAGRPSHSVVSRSNIGGPDAG
jgi:hypothetical protein